MSLLPSPNPGTPAYRQRVKKNMIFIGSMFIFGLLGALSMIMLIYFNIPQSEPARLLTAFLVIFFGALCTFSLLSAASLLGTIKVQAYLAQLKNKRSVID